MIPIPGDILLGTYYPWLNQGWGYPNKVPVKNALMSDVISLQYPWRYRVIEYIKKGELPLWDPSSFMGTSLIGNFQAAIFNPFNLLFFLPIPFKFVWGFQVVLQPLLAMIGMYLLLRNWVLSKAAAVFGAISYGFSGPLIIWMEYNQHGFAIAAVPYLVLCLDKYLESKQIKYLSLFSLFITFIVFAGYPQHLYYIILLTFTYLSFFLIYKKAFNKILFKEIGLFLGFLFLGVGFSAVQLLPGLDALSVSIKDIDVVAKINALTAMPFKYLVVAFIPDFFGNPTTQNYWGNGSYESFGFYTSLVSVVLAFLSLAFKNKRPYVFILALFVFLPIILSLSSPVTAAIQNMSWLGLNGSVGSRILFLYSFAISGLAAIGFEYILTMKVTDNFGIKYVYLLLPITIFILVLIISLTNVYYFYPDNLQVSIRNIIWPALIITVAFIITLFSISTKYKLTLYLLIVLLIADMFRFGWKYIPQTHEALVFPATKAIEFLQTQKPPFRIAIERAELLTANTWEAYNLESITGYNILLPHTSAEYLSYLNYDRPDLETARYIDVHEFSSKLMDLSNTKYAVAILRTKGVADAGGELPYYVKEAPKFKTIFQEGPVVILENSQVVERVYTVDSYRVISNGDEALRYLASEQMMAGKEVVLDINPEISNLKKCQVVLNRYSGQGYNIRADCQSPAILVITDTYNNGWQAYINNKKVPIYRANMNFMAIQLIPGNLNIDIKYSPRSFWQGLILSAFSLLVLLYIIWGQRFLLLLTRLMRKKISVRQ